MSNLSGKGSNIRARTSNLIWQRAVCSNASSLNPILGHRTNMHHLKMCSLLQPECGLPNWISVFKWFWNIYFKSCVKLSCLCCLGHLQAYWSLARCSTHSSAESSGTAMGIRGIACCPLAWLFLTRMMNGYFVNTWTGCNLKPYFLTALYPIPVVRPFSGINIQLEPARPLGLNL